MTNQKYGGSIWNLSRDLGNETILGVQTALNRKQRQKLKAQGHKLDDYRARVAGGTYKEKKEAKEHALPKCFRCKGELITRHPLENICAACLLANPKLTSEEKGRQNKWDKLELLERIIAIAKTARTYEEKLFSPARESVIEEQYHAEKVEGAKRWSWVGNFDCKYLDIRVDMRDGGCIVSAKGERIGIDALNWQYSEETPERPKT